MKMLLKRMIATLVMTTMMLSIVGCNNEVDTPSGDSVNETEIELETVSEMSSSETDEEVILTVWLPANAENENKVLSEIMDQYNENNKGRVKVEYEFVPRANAFAYEDKISAAVAIDQLPDLLMMDGPNVSNYAFNEIIKPLDNYFSDDDLSDFVDSMISQGTYDDKLYSLGPSESSVLIYYNQEIIDEAGIEIPTKLEDAWSFEEFVEILELVHIEGEVYGVNTAPDYGTGEWMTYMPTFFIWANGGDIISPDGMKAEGYLNSEKTIEAMTYFQSLAKYSNWQATPTEFEEGRAAFKICGSWLVPGFESNPDLKWGATYLPYNVSRETPSGDWTWGISSDENIEESVEFLKYILSYENIEKFVTVAGKPPTRKSLLNADGSIWDQYPRSVIKDQVINSGHARPSTPAYPVLTQEFASAAVDIFLGADVTERLNQAAKSIDESLKRYFE